MPQLNSGDYAEMAESYERQPPRRGEMIGVPVLNPRTTREPDAATGEEDDSSVIPEDPRGN